MAFLEERRRAREREQVQQAERSNNAPPAQGPTQNGAGKYNGYGAFLSDGEDDDANGFAVQQLKVEDCWKCLSGAGIAGEFLVCRHARFGTIVELFKDSSGGFSLQREEGAQVKYCSALCSMQDEPRGFAPQLVQRLCAGEGAKLAQGTAAGAWGAGMARANRLVFKARVRGRQGEPEEQVELYFTVDGFIFLSAGGFKCIGVKQGEFLPDLTRPEANKLLKEASAAS